MLYSVNVAIQATAYVRADNEQEAAALAARLIGETFELPEGEYGDVVISGLEFGSDELPALSLSPAMTVGNVDTDVQEVA